MQRTSELYQELLAGPHTAEVRLAIGDTGTLITKQGDSITFGGTSILVGATGADGGYAEDHLIALKTTGEIFAGTTPAVGGCVSARIDVEMIQPVSSIERQARLVPYVRLTDGTRYSEWVQKGVFYIDTRRKQEDVSGIVKLFLTGYDDILRTEQDYPSSRLSWPARDLQVVQEVAEYIGVSVDPRTVDLMVHGYRIPYPADYSCREVLGYIAAMYGGSFIMSDLGELRLVVFYGIPPETRYLIASAGQPITFGGVRIVV